MSRSKKSTSKERNYALKKRKMKPYCLTGEKPIIPAWIDDSPSYEDYNNIGDAKKARADLKIMKKTEKHQARQQAKKKLRKDLDDLDGNDR